MTHPTSQPRTRRSLARLVMPLLLALMVALQVQSASAGISWCRADPEIQIGGKSVNLFPERDAAVADVSDAPIVLVITHKAGLPAVVLSSDAGFDEGYAISFKTDSRFRDNQLRVEMYIPASTGSMAVRLVSVPTDPAYKAMTATGATNQWVILKTHV